MKKLVLLAGAALLASCGEYEAEAPEEEVAEEAEEMVEEAAMAPDGGPLAATYEVTPEEGDSWTTTINEDGSYTATYADGTVETGTMEMQDEDTACFDTAGDEEGPMCSDSTIAEDGTWTATGEMGTVTVVRVGG